MYANAFYRCTPVICNDDMNGFLTEPVWDVNSKDVYNKSSAFI